MFLDWSAPMRAFFAPETDAHDPRFFLVRGRVVANEERPERAARLLAGLARHGLRTETPPEIGDAGVQAVHRERYLRFLADASAHWSALPGAGPETVANVHPAFDDVVSPSYPESLVGRAGWHMADTACPIGPGSFAAALRGADTALAAAAAVMDGAVAAYALCRPPGHHATAERAGGHCLINNAAVAATALRRQHARVAVLDIDVHHGNGTQSIFYARDDVLTVSIHADPASFYPFFVGHAAERGAGAGEGFNLNLPLPLGSGNRDWLAAITAGLERVADFDPGAVVLSLGLDAHENDPLRGLSVSTAGFDAAGQLIGQAPWPMVLVQEGGYLSPDLTETLDAFLRGFLAQRG
jgi:acetoin utilization deacetylase AcuC-like enzyme